jgi:hypothetical protein
MNIWGRHVAGSGARTLSFVDDRTFWSSDFAQLEAAKTRSEEFDRLFQFKCSPAKSHIACASGAASGEFATNFFGYTVSSIGVLRCLLNLIWPKFRPA